MPERYDKKGQGSSQINQYSITRLEDFQLGGGSVVSTLSTLSTLSTPVGETQSNRAKEIRLRGWTWNVVSGNEGEPSELACLLLVYPKGVHLWENLDRICKSYC